MLTCAPTPPTASHDSLLGHVHTASASAPCSPLLRHQHTAQHPAAHCFSISTMQPPASASAHCFGNSTMQPTALASAHCRPHLYCTSVSAHCSPLLQHQHTTARCFGISTLQPAALVSAHCFGISPLLWHQPTTSASALCLSASQLDTTYQLISMLVRLAAACPAWAQAYCSAAHLGTSSLLSSYF